MWVYACPQFDQSTMQCDGAAWVYIPPPEPVLPPLSLGEGALVAASIGSVWALGAWFRFIKRATSV